MAVKLADTLQAMADFPVAMASGINIVKEDDTEKDLQQMYEDGELGGESMPMPLSANMLLVSENDETSGDLIWSQIDKSEVGSVPLICTEEEWEELDPKPVEGTEVIITDDEIDGDSLPFKFGIDENGNYGYYKVGADTVTPFKSGEVTILRGVLPKLATTTLVLEKDTNKIDLSVPFNDSYVSISVNGVPQSNVLTLYGQRDVGWGMSIGSIDGDFPSGTKLEIRNNTGADGGYMICY